MLRSPLVILHAVLNEGVVSVQDNVIFCNIFPIVFLSLKGNQASSPLLEATLPTEEASIELLTMTPNLFPLRSLQTQLIAVQLKWRLFMQPVLLLCCSHSKVVLPHVCMELQTHQTHLVGSNPAHGVGIGTR